MLLQKISLESCGAKRKTRVDQAKFRWAKPCDRPPSEAVLKF